MGNIIVNLVRFIVLLLLQVLLFKQFRFGWGANDYLHIFIYPLFILLLPTNTPRWAQLLLAFAMGLLVDQFYDSPGVHASALVFMAFVRLIILTYMEPPEKYPINSTLDIQTMGFNWFFRYTLILLIVHLFFYFSVETFTFREFFVILLKVILSLIGSFLVINIIMAIWFVLSNQNNRNRVRRI